ncbi:type II toxin-antitoxin system RelE family toxin [Vacuolonema iberomarrocanum]|uniref:type II toxin-antitoxin system RelE family toxin n=1 Tax=Vacuolonema iberomarrocanum TaxID=3454632 RepID=UPI0019E6E0EC|nr:type II toxin-antitoxin system RelE/ParE family toxin [filamentous cyanobacterium LEGE 07170]
MEINYSKRSVKFLKKLDETNQNRIREKILLLKNSLEQDGIIPFSEADIKQLKGNWEGFYRIRVGKIRIIFKIDELSNALLIYDISFRGSAYE